MFLFFSDQLVLFHPVSDFDPAGVRRSDVTPIPGEGGIVLPYKKDGEGGV